MKSPYAPKIALVVLVASFYSLGSHSLAQGQANPPTSSQSYTVFDAPNESVTFARSINDRGDVAGSFVDTSEGNKVHAYVRDQAGNFTVFDGPNASSTLVQSINNRGDVTGSFFDASQGHKLHGFVRDQAENFNVFDIPNADGTHSVSISINGHGKGAGLDANHTHTDNS